MIRAIHDLLLSNAVTRRLQRDVVVRLKATLGCPDAFDDIHKVIKQTNPVAILDVGSHVGKTIARLLERNDMPIHGFEPTSESFKRLEQRFASDSRVRVHNLALSNAEGTATLHCNENQQTNSLLDNDIGNKELLGGQTDHVATETITTMPLDAWAAKHLPEGPLFVKCDIQGAEGLLLDGGKQTFTERVVGFYSEAQIAPMYAGQTSFFELNATLSEELGFALANVYPCFRAEDGRALQTDALWIKRPKS